MRPPEFLEDAHERELEIKAAELRVRQLTELSCPNCEYPVEKNFLRCPNCQRRLKDPCPTCGKPVDPRWALCPYCETELAARSSAAARQRRDASAGARSRALRASRRSARAQESADAAHFEAGAGHARRREGGAAPRAQTTEKEHQP